MRHTILGQQGGVIEGMREGNRPTDLGEVRRPTPDGIRGHPFQDKRTSARVAEVDD